MNHLHLDSGGHWKEELPVSRDTSLTIASAEGEVTKACIGADGIKTRDQSQILRPTRFSKVGLASTISDPEFSDSRLKLLQEIFEM